MTALLVKGVAPQGETLQRMLFHMDAVNEQVQGMQGRVCKAEARKTSGAVATSQCRC